MRSVRRRRQIISNTQNTPNCHWQWKSANLWLTALQKPSLKPWERPPVWKQEVFGPTISFRKCPSIWKDPGGNKLEWDHWIKNLFKERRKQLSWRRKILSTHSLAETVHHRKSRVHWHRYDNNIPSLNIMWWILTKVRKSLSQQLWTK